MLRSEQFEKIDDDLTELPKSVFTSDSYCRELLTEYRRKRDSLQQR